MANLIVSGITLANSPYTISLSGADVATIRRMLNDDPISTTTTEVLDASEVGIDVTDGTLFTGGQEWEFSDDATNGDAEIVYVQSVASNTITVIRGYKQTTAQAHLTGAKMYNRPRFSYNLIVDAYNAAIQTDLWPDVYNIVEHQITPVTTTDTYVTPTANCEEFLNFYYVDANTTEVVFQERTRVHNGDTSLWATGKYFHMASPTTGTVYANCIHRYDYSTLSVEVARAVQNLCCANLLLWAELPRTAGPTNQGDRTVQPRTQATLAREFRAVAERILKTERARLRKQVRSGRSFIRSHAYPGV